MAFASRQARGRRWRNWWRWRASSSAANSSSSRGLTIRCRTMTAIHRSGRCDKRDKESRRGCRMEPFRSLPLREHRRGQGSRRKPLRSEGEGRQCATMSPDIRIAAPHCYTYRTESPLHSGFVGHPPATLEKRVPINKPATPPIAMVRIITLDFKLAAAMSCPCTKTRPTALRDLEKTS